MARHFPFGGGATSPCGSPEPGWFLRAFAERLADSRTRLDQLQGCNLAVRTAFEVCYEALDNSDDPIDQSATSAFRAMGLLDKPSLGVPVIATLLAGRPKAVESSRASRDNRPGVSAD